MSGKLIFLYLSEKLKCFILDVFYVSKLVRGLTKIIIHSLFTKYVLLYWTSLCFSPSERFLFCSEPYCCFLFFYSLESSWYLPRAFSESLLLLLYVADDFLDIFVYEKNSKSLLLKWELMVGMAFSKYVVIFCNGQFNIR